MNGKRKMSWKGRKKKSVIYEQINTFIAFTGIIVFYCRCKNGGEETTHPTGGNDLRGFSNVNIPPSGPPIRVYVHKPRARDSSHSRCSFFITPAARGRRRFREREGQKQERRHDDGGQQHTDLWWDPDPPALLGTGDIFYMVTCCGAKELWH